MKTLTNFRKILQSKEYLDQSNIDYYKSEYEKLKDLSNITIQVSDFEGNKTKFHSLNLESLIELVYLLERKGA